MLFKRERPPPKKKPKPLDTKDRDKKPSERSRSVILLEAHQSSRMYTCNNTSHASFLLSFFSTLFGRVFFFDTFSPTTTLCFYSSYSFHCCSFCLYDIFDKEEERRRRRQRKKKKGSQKKALKKKKKTLSSSRYNAGS